MTLNNAQLQTVVDAGGFDTLIGEVEGAEFECKNQPYRIETEAGKRELAKDVSAFANSSGGFIFIGIKTKPSTVYFGDEVEIIRPFASTLVNTSQYEDILSAWIFPNASKVDISWVATKADSTRGVVVIKIPPQNTGMAPFLITKTIEGTKNVETVFGYASRKGDKNPPLGVKELQSYVRSGMHYQETLEDRLSNIESMLRESSDRSTQQEAQQKTIEQIEARISRAVEMGTLKDGRLLTLSAHALEQHDLKTIFSSGDGTIKHSLEHPPILRRHGWGMETLDQAKIQRGEYVRLTNGTRKVIDLYRDGSMIFATSADENFLAWGQEVSVKINPLALIEVIYSFVDLYRLVLADYSTIPKKLSFRVELRNMHLGGIKNSLAPYSVKSFEQQFSTEIQEAPDDNWSSTKTFEVSDFDVAAISYDLVREVYLWFGIEEDKIPYVKEIEGVKAVDAEAITNGG